MPIASSSIARVAISRSSAKLEKIDGRPLIAINPSREVRNKCINGGNVIDFERSPAGSWGVAWENQRANRQVAAHLHLFFEGDARTRICLLSTKDVEISVADGMLTIRGEKKTEKDERKKAIA